MGTGFSQLGAMSRTNLMKVFIKYDKDNSRTVDQGELLVMMDEMKLVRRPPLDWHHCPPLTAAHAGFGQHPGEQRLPGGVPGQVGRRRGRRRAA